MYESFQVPTMQAKMSYGKVAFWMPITVLIASVNVIAQPGFLSIDCGAETNHTAENKIRWVTDANYINVGETAAIGDGSENAYGSYLHNLRFFPKPLIKSCYRLPVAPNVPYLLRSSFAIGNYTGFNSSSLSFQLSIETLGMLAFENITIEKNDVGSYERIFVSSGRVLYVCLIRTSENDDPFINAIELRTLLHGMYRPAKPGTSLKTDDRVDFGGVSTLRYPEDNFDRIWPSYYKFEAHDIAGVRFVSSGEPISTNNTENLPPTAVMQTACVANSSTFPFGVGSPNGKKSLLVLYLAEIEKLNMSERRSFYVIINGEQRSGIITMVKNYSTIELSFLSDEATDIRLELKQASNSTSSPIINAYESYIVVDTEAPTYSQDIEHLDKIKTRFNIIDWISDPCYLIPWKGIRCDNRSSNIRISELNLSQRSFTGAVPADIGHLTALVNLSLANNHLIESLPNFSNLTMLERLHLQNNNLSGSLPQWLSQLKKLKELLLDNNNLIGSLPNLSNLTMLEKLYLRNNNLSGTLPEWLSELKNLTELFIQNNNFSGVIPVQLLNRQSLNINFSGNHYLCNRTHNGKCVLYNSRNLHKPSHVVLGITISGALIISIALMVAVAVHFKNVGIVVYWNKFKTKLPLNEDNSMIMVPNATKCRAFTLQQIMVATHNFSRKIGQGGFGSVFFGKLPEGRDIAVKVLSQFSRQGIHEFHTEIDLLSRIHHKNLVSLLGYCNESRELMLIYDHMSGGSLRDSLYGSNGAEFSALNWTTRLKIALNAAQGLEYLHLGCTPKIIHRDIKTSNILLDSYMNGKLADFGLSKMTVEGEASHVTTMVKGTPGYLDPDYFRTQMLTEKSDVYSFGVVLLEIICGRPPISTHLAEEQVNLVQWVTPYVYVEMDENPDKSISGEIGEIVDKRMGGNYYIKSIVGVAKLALRCVEAKPSSRASVSEVVAKIKEAIIEENNNNNNNALPLFEGLGIEHGDLEPGPVRLTGESSKPKDMVWHDNSSNITQVGR